MSGPERGWVRVKGTKLTFFFSLMQVSVLGVLTLGGHVGRR